MKTLVVLVTHCLLVSSFYLREKRQSESESEDPVVRPPGNILGARSASFAIQDKYPRKPDVILKKEMPISFNCSSTRPWYSCSWKSPFIDKPCGIQEGDNVKDCDSWISDGNFQVRSHQDRALHVCSIHGKIGYDPSHNDEGKWSCRLEDADYDHDIYEFMVTHLKPALVTLTIGDITRNQEQRSGRKKRNIGESNHGKETELQPEDTVEVTCSAEEAIPQPIIVWYMGKQKVEFESSTFRDDFQLLHEEKPKEVDGLYSSSQTIRYTARLAHNKRYIRCVAEQIDDEGNKNLVESQDDLNLLIREIIVPGVSMAMIGSIIGAIIILLLAILLLLLAWKTKRFCFQEKESFTVREIYTGPPLCPGCRDTNPLLSKNHNHTCEIGIQGNEPEGTVNKITKYRTEIILLTDKMIGNPASTKTVEEFDKLTQHVEGMMRGMASNETDEALKNRFLMAAQGLTNSVGVLMDATGKAAENPHSEKERRQARNAGEELKSAVTQSVDTIRRIHAMKDLKSTAEAAVKAAKETKEVVTDALNTDPASHEKMDKACTEMARVTDILDQALIFYVENPTSAKAQTGLMAAARGFLEPAEICLEKSKETIPELAFEASADKLRETSGTFAERVKELEASVESSELCADSLITELATDLVRSLQAELEETKADVAKGKLKLLPEESLENATEQLIELSGNTRSAGSSCLLCCLAGDRPGMDKAAGNVVDILSEMKTLVKAAAAGAKDKTAQMLVLDTGLGVMEQAENLLSSGQKAVVNPANPVAATTLVGARENLSQAVSASLLATVPGGCIKASQHIADDLCKELEEFKAAVNAFQVKPIPGITVEYVSNKLDAATGSIEKNVADLVGSSGKGDEFGSQESARYVALALDDYTSAVRAAVTIMTDRDVQQSLLNKGSSVVSGTGNILREAEVVLAQPGNADASRRLHNSAAELTKSMKSLEQAYMYGAPGQEQFVSALNIMKHATKELRNPTPTERRDDIGQLKTRMMTATKEIAGLAHDIQTKAHADPGEMDGLTFLAQKYKNLASDVNQLMEQAEDDEVGHETLNSVTSLGKSILQLIEGTAGHQVRPGQASLLQIANQAQAVAGSSVQTLSSVNNLARRAQALDIIGKHLAGVLHNLDTTIMFASAGTLNVEDENDTFAAEREEILKYAQVLVTDVQAVLTGSTSAKGELITASEQSLGNMQHLAERIKSAASCLGPENQEAQVMLLNTAKDVCSSLVELIHQAKTANGQNIDHPSFGQVKNHSKSVIMNITNLLKSVKTFEDESSRGTRAMESSIAAIGQELLLFKSEDAPTVVASSEDLVRANKAITAATSKAVAAASSGGQEDLLAVANIGRRAIAELLQTCRGAVMECDNEALKTETLAKGEELAIQYQQLLQSVIAGASKETLMEYSRNIAYTATALAQLAEKLKGENWVNQFDPIIIAETELLNAAESIEQAALKLSQLVPRGPTAEQRDLENMSFNELIIDSAQSIAKATSSLIKAATEAQRELVAQGRVTAETVVGSEAGQWSEGLVSAAKLVASATRSLCETANNLVIGEGGEEHLIAAAKAVSKSTAQLVLACKVKADGWETSSAMIGLNTASIAVRKATDALVNAAKGSIDRVSTSKVRVDIYKEMIEADARVIRLEKEVGEAKEREEDMKEQSKITGTVSDMKKAREAEAQVQTLTKELELAVSHKLRLNEKQYNTLPRL